MFRHCTRLRGFKLGATDGEIGKVEDFFFDLRNWTVRYLVADTGYWLPDRLVLISPHALGQVDEEGKMLLVNLTRRQIEESPPITADQPLSREYEREYYRHYGWPAYWTGPSLWGPAPSPIFYAPFPPETPVQPPADKGGDPDLRSVKEMIPYHIQARDGEIGHVDDALIEDTNWAIRYLIVDTRNWLPGKKVLLAPQWIEAVDWEKALVSVDLPRQRIQEAPEYDTDAPISREYEVRLFQHYSREGYWDGQNSSHQNAA